MTDADMKQFEAECRADPLSQRLRRIRAYVDERLQWEREQIAKALEEQAAFDQKLSDGTNSAYDSHGTAAQTLREWAKRIRSGDYE